MLIPSEACIAIWMLFWAESAATAAEPAFTRTILDNGSVVLVEFQPALAPLSVISRVSSRPLSAPVVPALGCRVEQRDATDVFVERVTCTAEGAREAVLGALSWAGAPENSGSLLFVASAVLPPFAAEVPKDGEGASLLVEAADRGGSPLPHGGLTRDFLGPPPRRMPAPQCAGQVWETPPTAVGSASDIDLGETSWSIGGGGSEAYFAALLAAEWLTWRARAGGAEVACSVRPGRSNSVLVCRGSPAATLRDELRSIVSSRRPRNDQVTSWRNCTAKSIYDAMWHLSDLEAHVALVELAMIVDGSDPSALRASLDSAHFEAVAVVVRGDEE